MALSLTDPNARLLRHTILGNAMQVVPDGSGRILLSQNLRDYANLKDEVVFVGQGDYFEIWAAEPWQAAARPRSTMQRRMPSGSPHST